MTIQCNMNEPLWVERYRPNTINDCILPKRIKAQFNDIVKEGRIPNLLLSGGAGTGKTTVSRALCLELDVDWLIINCSEETGIDTLRTKIKDFASTVSFSDNGKCVILDEFDYASPNLQAGMRNAMEAFSRTCSFILTCNYPNRIIDALKSRTVGIAFDNPKEEIPLLQATFFKRIVSILENEEIKFDQRAVIQLVQKFFPDNRRILGQLQQYGRAGEIDAGILLDLNDIGVEDLIKAMKNKSFKEVKQWCVENSQNDLSNLYTKLYKALPSQIEGSSIPEAIMIINDAQRYDSIVPDKELHCAALAIQLMMSLTFK